MENKVLPAVISAYCTLMLSSAFLSVGDGMLLASAAAGFSAVETKVREQLSGLDNSGFAGARDWRPAPVQAAQGTAAVAPISVPTIITTLRKNGRDTVLQEHVARAFGLPLRPGEGDIPAKGEAYGTTEIRRKIFVPSDEVRNFALLVLANDAEAVYFLTSPSGRLEKAMSNSAKDPTLRPVSGPLVEQRFSELLDYWQETLGATPVAALGPITVAQNRRDNIAGRPFVIQAPDPPGH